MKRILFLTPSPIESASERYRVYQFLPFLEKAGFQCTVLPFAAQALHQAIQRERLTSKLLLTPLCYLRRAVQLPAMARYDAVIVHRGIFPFPWPALERLIFRSGKKLIFDFDDAVHVGHQNIGAAKYPWIYRLKYGPGVNEMLRLAWHVIAGNRTLAEHAVKFNRRVSVIPTVVDVEQYAYQAPRVSDEPLTIGWVGSRSTSPYLVEVGEALRRLSAAHPGKVRFRFFGDAERKLELANCESSPFSLSREIADLKSIDIGIMPVPDNEWTRGKCAFKAIQYMALGIPCVVSPVGMTTELVQHDVNGFCARTPEEWYWALDHLVKNAQTRQRFSEAGRKTIESRYALQCWAPRLVELLQGVLAEPSAVMSPRTVNASS